MWRHSRMRRNLTQVNFSKSRARACYDVKINWRKFRWTTTLSRQENPKWRRWKRKRQYIVSRKQEHISGNVACHWHLKKKSSSVQKISKKKSSNVSKISNTFVGGLLKEKPYFFVHPCSMEHVKPWTISQFLPIVRTTHLDPFDKDGGTPSQPHAIYFIYFLALQGVPQTQV